MKKIRLLKYKIPLLKYFLYCVLFFFAGVKTSPALAGEENQASSKPTIPKPDTGIGPEQKDAETYFNQTFIPFFTKSFIQISGLVAVIFMIIAGVQFLTSFGNEEKITEAKKAATYSAVGFAITLLAYAIVSILNSLDIISTPLEDE